MEKTFYVVRALLNGREGTKPSEFSTKEAATLFINILDVMNDGILDYEFHLYEVKEIDY